MNKVFSVFLPLSNFDVVVSIFERITMIYGYIRMFDVFTLLFICWVLFLKLNNLFFQGNYLHENSMNTEFSLRFRYFLGSWMNNWSHIISLYFPFIITLSTDLLLKSRNTSESMWAVSKKIWMFPEKFSPF